MLWPTDLEQPMSVSWETILKRHCGRNLFEVRSRIKGAGSTFGYVVDFSETFVLFHLVRKDAFCFNGYCALKSDDIKDYRAFSRQEHWQNRAAKTFRLKPKRPAGISLDTLPTLLESVSNRYPLMVIHMERKYPNDCYIGPLISLAEKTFTIDDLDCGCNWSGPRRIKLEDVTRIGFGGGYESALAATAPKRSERGQLVRRKRFKK